jgi:anaerobic ribonucleoside-triphosphate reductase
MDIFGKKDKEKSQKDIAKLLVDAATGMIKSGMYTRATMSFIKTAIEFNTMVAKSEIDNDRFLLEKLEAVIKIRQEDGEETPKNSGKYIISMYETLPDLIKNAKLMLDLKEKKFEELKKSGDDIIKPLKDILEEWDKNGTN